MIWTTVWTGDCTMHGPNANDTLYGFTAKHDHDTIADLPRIRTVNFLQ